MFRIAKSKPRSLEFHTPCSSWLGFAVDIWLTAQFCLVVRTFPARCENLLMDPIKDFPLCCVWLDVPNATRTEKKTNLKELLHNSVYSWITYSLQTKPPVTDSPQDKLRNLSLILFSSSAISRKKKRWDKSKATSWLLLSAFLY